MSDVVLGESMMGGDTENSNQPNLAPTSAGQQLAARRESLGWTIEQVSSQLNLAPRQIHALETDNFAALPGMAISRGFLRAYAKLLKIDPAPLLALISNEAGPAGEPVPMRHALSASFSESRLPSMGTEGISNKKLTVGLAAAVLIGGAVAAWQLGVFPDVVNAVSAKIKTLSSRDSADQSTNAEKGVSSEVSKMNEAPGPTDGVQSAVSSPAAVSDSIGDQSKSGAQNQIVAATPAEPSSGSTTVTLPLPTAASAITSAVAIPANSLASPAVKSVLPQPPATASTTTGTAMPAKDALVLKLREDSWVEIKGKNKVFIARVVKAGSTESFDITEPISLTIGNASGVDGNFRGAAIDFKSATKTNVVKMNLK